MRNAAIVGFQKLSASIVFYHWLTMPKSRTPITLLVDPKVISDIGVNMAVIATKTDEIQKDLKDVKERYATKQELEIVREQFRPTRVWMDRLLGTIFTAVIAALLGLIMYIT